MKRNPITVIADTLALANDAINFLPKTRRAELQSRLTALTDDHHQLSLVGRGSHWKEYRERQCFLIQVFDADGVYQNKEFVIKGIETLAKELGWKISTLRSQLSMKKGEIVVPRQPRRKTGASLANTIPHPFEKWTITRLPLNP